MAAFPITIPFLSHLTEKDRELFSMIQVMYFVPFEGSDGIKSLKGGYNSWADALQALKDELSTNAEKHHDTKSFERLTDMQRMARSTSKSMKIEFKEANNEENLKIVTMSWPDTCMMTDSTLLQEYGFESAETVYGVQCKNYCWNCGKRNCKLLACGKCQKALYCSKECQASSYWHHKRTTSLPYACVE